MRAAASTRAVDVSALRRAVAMLERSERLPAEALAAHQHRALVALAHYHRAQSPAFAARLAAAGLAPDDLATSAGLRALPVLDRRAMQLAGEDFFVREAPADHGEVFGTATSGSTGEPVRVRRTMRGALDWMAMTMRDHRWHRRDFAWRFCAVRAHLPRVDERPDWGRPVSLFHASGPSLGVPITLSVEAQLPVIAAFAPQTMLLYPSSLAGLLDHWEGGGAPPLRDLRTMGETLPPELRARCRDMLGIVPADAYSTEEVGYLALTCPDEGGLHVMAETVLVELLDAAGAPVATPGAVGRVVVTDLFNYASPLIRYDLGDLAEAGRPCGCGRGLPTLGRVLGRTRNLAVTPDGRRFWPLVGFRRYRNVAPVRQYQFVQHTPERIEARLHVERALTPVEETALREVMLASLGYRFTLDFTYSDERLPPGPTGKFDEFINRIAPA